MTVLMKYYEWNALKGDIGGINGDTVRISKRNLACHSCADQAGVLMIHSAEGQYRTIDTSIFRQTRPLGFCCWFFFWIMPSY